MIETVKFDRHGGPYDRGAADSYYRRKYSPHYYVGGTGTSTRVEADTMTYDELTPYQAGWEDNENGGDFKDYR